MNIQLIRFSLYKGFEIGDHTKAASSPIELVFTLGMQKISAPFKG